MSGHFQHPQALVESDQIGEGTRIWAFAHVMKGAVVGRDCNICDHCFVESGARIGDGVTVKNNVAVWDGVTVEEGAFLGPGAVLTNDRKPRSRNPDWSLSKTRIGRGATVGAGAAVLCGISIGAFAFVAAGAVVTKEVPDHALVMGNPARVRGYVCRCGERIAFRKAQARCAKCGGRYAKGKGGVAPLEEAGR
ncbi:MAG: acyltransferase [Planctomycetota bacterium]|jgi:acetyltransferase-like isoleucine patch superfamily enzyme